MISRSKVRSGLRYAVSLAAALGLVVVTSGCIYLPAPRSSPSPTATVAPTPVPSPTVRPTVRPPTVPTPPAAPTAPSWSQTIPTDAQAHTEAGAAAFVRFYIEAVNASWSAPDDEVLAQLGTAECSSCDDYLEQSRFLMNNGQHNNGPTMEVLSQSISSFTSARAVLSVQLEGLAVETVDAQGHVLSTAESEVFNCTVSVVWRDGRWFLDSLVGES